MANEKKITQNNRRTLSDRLDDALASKPTQRYLQSRGLSVAQIRTSVSPDKQVIIERRMRAIKAAAPPPKPVAARRPDPHEFTILVTGGLGDVMTIESYLTDDQRRNLKGVYYATRQAAAARKMFEAIPSYRRVEHVVVWEDFSKFFAFYSKAEVEDRLKKSKVALPKNWWAVQDHSIAAVFPLVNSGTVTYNGSSLLTQPVADLTEKQLPADYVAVCPYTINDKRSASRDFDQKDWDRLIKHIESKGTTGVVVNQGTDPVPTHPRIMDLSNRTTLAEAVEVIKQAKGYFGIDSAFSVLAAKLFDPPDIVVKTRNPFLLSYKHVYYAPKKAYGFIRERLEIDG